MAKENERNRELPAKMLSSGTEVKCQSDQYIQSQPNFFLSFVHSGTGSLVGVPSVEKRIKPPPDIVGIIILKSVCW